MAQILHITAARYALGAATSENLVSAADQALAQGMYCQALGELWSAQPIMADVGPLFEKVLREVGIPLPSREEAVWMLRRWYIGLIVERAIPPREGLRLLISEARSVENWPSSGDFHVVQDLAVCSFAYEENWDDPQGAPGKEEVDVLNHEAVSQAKAWLARYGPAQPF